MDEKTFSLVAGVIFAVVAPNGVPQRAREGEMSLEDAQHLEPLENFHRF
jgi:hypothetical protein